MLDILGPMQGLLRTFLAGAFKASVHIVPKHPLRLSDTRLLSVEMPFAKSKSNV